MRHQELSPVFVEEMPSDLEQGKLYISEMYDVGIHLCACGCGEKTVTPLGGSIGWGYERKGDLISLSPSIGNFSFPCRSHYFIKKNKIIWL